MSEQAAEQSTTEQTEQPTQESALRQAATIAPAFTEQPVIPDKFQVKREDGTLDYEASSLKMAQSYTYLEKKLGTGEAPPKSPDEYQIQFSEGTPITFDELKGDQGIQDFMQGAHKLGMTNAQVNYVLDTYMQTLPQDLHAMAELDSRETVATLTQEFGAAGAQEVLADAYRAVVSVAGDDADYIMDNYGNDPIVIKFLAKYGEGLREDSPPLAMQTIDPQQFSETTHEIRQQLSEMNLQDPRRPALLAKLDELYNKQYKDVQ